MTHEILALNSNRAYVKVGDVWYDTHRDLFPQTGANFLTGKISEVLSYEDYINTYPESTNEMMSAVNEKTISGGFIRKASSEEGHTMVKYAVNPVLSLATSKQDFN